MKKNTDADCAEKLKTLEAELKYQKEYSATLMNTVPSAIFSVDKNRKITSWNKMAETLTGYSCQEVIGQDCRMMAHLPCQESCGLYSADSKPILNQECVICRKDGTPITVLKNIEELKNEAGELIGGIESFIDISAIRETEKKLRQNQAQYKTVFYQNKSIMLLIDPVNGKIVDANVSACQFYGWSHDEICRMNISEINTLSDEEVKAQMQEALTNQRKHFFFKHRLASGEIRDVEVHSSSIEYGGSTVLYSIVYDITDRKLAEEKIRDQTERHNAIINSIPDMIFVIDRNGIINEYHFNDMSMAAMPADEIVGTDIRTLFGPELATMHLENLAKCIEQSQTVIYDYSLIISNEESFFEARMVPMSDKGAMVFVRDISERKRTEDQLRKLSNAVEQSPVSIVITDLNGDIEYANPKACETTGYSLEELLGKNPRVLKSGETRSGEYDILWRNISSGKEWQGIFHNKRKNGELYWESCDINPIIDANGKITHYLAIKVDITENIKMQEALLKSEERFTQIVEQSQTVIWEVDANGLYTYVSHIAEVVWGYSPEELVGKMHFYDIHPPEGRDEFKEAALASFARKEIFKDLVNSILTKNREIIWVSTNGVPLTDDQNNLTGYRGADNNITQRKKAEEEALKWKYVFENAKWGVVVANMKTSTTELMNPEFARMHGYTVEEQIREPIFSAFAPETADTFPAQMKIAQEQGHHNFESIHIKKDGSRFPVMVDVTVAKDQEGNDLYRIVNVLDITERKRSEAWLQKQHDLSVALISAGDLQEALMAVLHALFQLEGIDSGGIYLATPSGQLDLISHFGLSNEFVARATFYEADDPNALMVHAGKPIYQKYPDILAMVSDGFISEQEGLQALAIVPIQFEGRVIAALNLASHTHEEISTEVRTIIETLAAQIGGVVARLSTAKELQESRANLQELFDTLEDFLFILDDEGKIIQVNPVVIKRLGFSEDEIVGQHVLLLHPQDRREEASKIIAEMLAGKVSYCPVPLITKAGVQIPVETKVMQGTWGGMPSLFGISRDITERKHAEDAILEANRQLKEAIIRAEASNIAKGQFLANMSHEIRTPMNGIIGYLDLISSSTLSDEQQEYVHQAKSASDILLNLLNDILDLSKIEAGKLTLHNVRFNLKTVIQASVSLFAPMAHEKNLDIQKRIGSNVPEVVIGDPSRLRQILNNLISNSLKFTEKGKISIEVETLEVRDGFVMVKFEVEDTGIGISEQDMKKLFKPFSQADASTTRKYGGTGLGLAITADLVKMMHGETGAESLPGKGSTFYFTARFEIPQTEKGATADIGFVRDTADILPSTPENIPEKKQHVSGVRILLVEDNEMNCKMVTRMLKSRHLDCDVVMNGKDACEAVLNGNYDIVFMDCSMPVMDGYEATQKIRAAEAGSKHTRIIALTANAMAGTREKCLNAGMDDYITKPLDFELMFKLIEGAF